MTANLIACPDCEKSISKNAATCIHCGRSMNAMVGKAMQTQRRGGKYEAIGFVIILAGIGLCFLSAYLGGAVITLGFVAFIIGRFM